MSINNWWKLSLISGVILMLQAEAEASFRDQLIPDYLRFHYAGGIGIVSVGGGFHHHQEKLNSELIWGYVPPANGASSIHTLAFRTHYRIKTRSMASNLESHRTIGLSMNIAMTHNTHFKWPDRFPSRYYPPNNLRLMVFIGHTISVYLENSRVFERISFNIEIGTFDKYLVDAFRHASFQLPRLNLSLGSHLHF